MPSSRSKPFISTSQVLEPQGPIPALVIDFIKFISVIPFLIRARTSPAVTLSHKQTIASSAVFSKRTGFVNGAETFAS